jgi:hypothetical protein
VAMWIHAFDSLTHVVSATTRFQYFVLGPQEPDVPVTSCKTVGTATRIHEEAPPMNPRPPLPSGPNLTDLRLEPQIRQRAYVLYEARGRADGRALDDWLRAEKEVLSLREAKTAAATS